MDGDPRVLGSIVDIGADEYLAQWNAAYNKLFDSQSDLALCREYRDTSLMNTRRGKFFTKSLYRNSKAALKVLLENPDLMAEAKVLIDANKNAIADVLDGSEGVIYITPMKLSLS